MDKEKLNEILQSGAYKDWKDLYELDPSIAAIDSNNQLFLNAMKMEQSQPQDTGMQKEELNDLIQGAAFRKWQSIYETNPDAAEMLPNHVEFLKIYQQRQGKAGGGLAYLMGM